MPLLQQLLAHAMQTPWLPQLLSCLAQFRTAAAATVSLQAFTLTAHLRRRGVTVQLPMVKLQLQSIASLMMIRHGRS